MAIKHKLWRFITGLAAVLVAGLLFLAHSGEARAADAMWSATYWNNRNLSGTPFLQRQESDINYDWGDGVPATGIDKDAFSARWTRSINFSAGTYRFTVTTDDGMRVYIDDVLVLDSWWDSQVHSVSADVALAAGDHRFKVEYYEAGGKAVAKLNWVAISGPPSVTITHWQGAYYNNPTLSGSPVLVRNDERINFDWGGGAPGANVPADNFSVRWNRTITLDQGRYRFNVIVDDGVRLWVNGRLIIDKWHDSGTVSYSGEIDLPGGAVPVQMEYYEHQGGAVAKMSYDKISGGGSGQWRGEYFNNRNFTGSPVLVRDDSQINFNWGNGSPNAAIPADNFAVRWTRTQNFVAGRYRFSATSDDGVRVWVNGQLVINAWNDHQPQTFTGDIDLPNGTIPIQVEYYEATGGAQVQVSWTAVTTQPPVVVPPAPSASTATVVSFRLNVRVGPGLQYGIITTLNRGTQVNLTGFRSADAGWVQINMANGTQAWVSARPAYLQTNVPVANLAVWQGTIPGTGGPTPPSSGTPVATVTNAYYLNVRSAPVVANNILTVVPAGTTVQLLGRNTSASWAKVRLANGTVGWVSTSYLISSTMFANLPITN